MRRWIPAIAIIALLVAGLLLIRPAPELGSFTLSDGTVLEVAKITTGPVHRFRYDNRWQDYLGYVLPKTLRAKLNPHILELIETNSCSLVVWTKSRGRPPAVRGLEITVTDESGIEVPTLRSSGIVRLARPTLLARPTAMMMASSNVSVSGWLVAPLPHHAREIGIGFHEGQSRIGYFKLPNPSFVRTRKVTLDTPPLVRSSGDIQMKLASVDVSRNLQNTSRVDWTISAEMIREGAPVSDWRLEGIDVLSDGELFAQTGSVMGFGAGSFSGIARYGDSLSSGLPGPRFLPTGGRGLPEASLHLLPGLWPDAIWTVRLWAVQQDNFAPEQIWILNGVPVTNAVEWKVERSEQRQVGAKKVELLGFRGPQVTYSKPGSNGRSFSGSAGDVNACFAVPPQGEGIRITFLRGRDDQGRTIDHANNSYSTVSAVPWTTTSAAPWTISLPPGQHEVTIQGFTVRPTPDAKSLTLEFAVHRARSVDFIVKPTKRP